MVNQPIARKGVDLGDSPDSTMLVDLVSYNQNLWIDHPFEGAAYLPR